MVVDLRVFTGLWEKFHRVLIILEFMENISASLTATSVKKDSENYLPEYLRKNIYEFQLFLA